LANRGHLLKAHSTGVVLAVVQSRVGRNYRYYSHEPFRRFRNILLVYSLSILVTHSPVTIMQWSTVTCLCAVLLLQGPVGDASFWDIIPLFSQGTSIVQFANGDPEVVRQTENNFLIQMPPVSQIKSVVEYPPTTRRRCGTRRCIF